MNRLAAMAVAAFLGIGGLSAAAQELVDKGFVHGWNLMVDPAMGNGCLIQTVYQDQSLVRLGFDATQKKGYFTVFNRDWGDIGQGRRYDVRFDLDGESFDAVATGFRQGKVPAAVVFFDDREFVHAIARHQGMTIYGQNGQKVMAIDLSGTAKALEYARKCQDEMGW